jgi:hypothetical protein
MNEYHVDANRLYEFAKEKWFERDWKFDEFRVAASEAIEVLEDRVEFEKGRGDGWRDAASAFYKETLALKQSNSGLNHLRTASYLLVERDNHAKTRAALKDAEARIKELHEINERQASELRAAWRDCNAESERANDAEARNRNQAVTIRDLRIETNKLDTIRKALA